MAPVSNNRHYETIRFHADPDEIGITSTQYEEEKITRALLDNMKPNEFYVFRQRLAPELGSLASEWLLHVDNVKAKVYNSIGVVLVSEVVLGAITSYRQALYFAGDSLMYAESDDEETDRIDIGYLLSSAKEGSDPLPGLNKRARIPVLAGQR